MKRKGEDYDLDPNDPIDLLFVKIDEIADIYSLQKNEMTEKQLVQMAYEVIERVKAFKKTYVSGIANGMSIKHGLGSNNILGMRSKSYGIQGILQ